MSKIIFPSNNNHNVFKKIIHWIVFIEESLKDNQKDKLVKESLINIMNQLDNPLTEDIFTVINNLEHIAETHPQYYWKIMEILASFVRDSTRVIAEKDVLKKRPFIQAAMNVIVKKEIKSEAEQIDLSYTDLREINLPGAKLKNANLYRTNLAGANLTAANLEGVILTAANLSNANLSNANLSGAILSAAKLNQTNLSGANLHRANLYLARLENTILDNAILSETNMREVKQSKLHGKMD
jgi:hypothetical protein